jgi:hypothetical protein
MLRLAAVLLILLVFVLTLSSCGGGVSAGPSPSSPGSLTITSISPNTATAGSADLTLTIAGTDFDLTHAGNPQLTRTLATWSVNSNQTSLPTTVVSSTQITASVPQALLATPAKAQISIQKWFFADAVVGGANGCAPDAADDPPWDPLFAELYEPDSGNFRGAGNMSTTRIHHAAVRLANGEVLVLGGIPSLQNLLEQPSNPSYAEVYDRRANTFSPMTGSQMWTEASVKDEYLFGSRFSFGNLCVGFDSLFKRIGFGLRNT